MMVKLILGIISSYALEHGRIFHGKNGYMDSFIH